MPVKAVLFEPDRLSDYDETARAFGKVIQRYCIIDSDTGEILDDAQGYGYKTAQKAHAAWSYRNRDSGKSAAKIKRHGEVWDWLRTNSSFERDMQHEAFFDCERCFGSKCKLQRRLCSEHVG